MKTRFDFTEFKRRTEGLSSSEQLAILWQLPEVLQAEAFACLREQSDWRSQRDFEETCGDDR